jgi:hypothetical protein
MLPIVDVIVLGLAIWRLSSLISRESGPYNIFALLRFRTGVVYNKMSEEIPSSELSRGILCLWCVSIWISIPLCALYFFFPVWAIFMCLPFAVSAVAILADGCVDRGV